MKEEIKEINRYSEALKQKIVAEVLGGELTAKEASRRVLPHFSLTNLKNLSEGQRMRINLVRVFCSPEGTALLLDEPTNSIDSACAEIFRDKLAEFSITRIIILVTHAPESYFDLSSRVIMLNQGQFSKIPLNHTLN